MCRRRGLKVNASKSKVMVLGGEEGLECEVCLDGMRLEHISEFKYWVRSMVKARSSQLGCARGLH